MKQRRTVASRRAALAMVALTCVLALTPPAAAHVDKDAERTTVRIPERGVTPQGIPERDVYHHLLPVHTFMNQCLDVYSGEPVDRLPLQNFWCDDIKPHQRWKLVPYGDGIHFWIQNGLGKCLDVDGGATWDEARIIQYTCKWDANPWGNPWESGSNQMFWLYQYGPVGPYGHEVYGIANRYSDKYLDVYQARQDPETPVIQYHRTGGTNQQWVFIRS